MFSGRTLLLMMLEDDEARFVVTKEAKGDGGRFVVVATRVVTSNFLLFYFFHHPPFVRIALRSFELLVLSFRTARLFLRFRSTWSMHSSQADNCSGQREDEESGFGLLITA